MNSPTCALHPDQYAGATCPRCGNFTCATCNPDGKTLCPTCRALVQDGERGKVPWERRDELGLVTAFWQQVKLTCFEPRKFWATVDRNGTAGDAFWFGWLVTIVGAIGSAPYQAFNFWSQARQFQDIQSGMGSDLAQFKSFFGLFAWLGEHPVLAALGFVAYAIAIFPLGFFINVGMVHVGCLIAGMRNHPMSVTARAIGYATAPNLAMVIPVVGGFAGIYTLVLQIWGLRELQQGTTGRAIIATLWFSLVFACCIVAAGVAVAMMVASKL
ncbi:MAG: hypothetical protein ACO1OB_07590 [Archangium sp.]